MRVIIDKLAVASTRSNHTQFLLHHRFFIFRWCFAKTQSLQCNICLFARWHRTQLIMTFGSGFWGLNLFQSRNHVLLTFLGNEYKMLNPLFYALLLIGFNSKSYFWFASNHNWSKPILLLCFALFFWNSLKFCLRHKAQTVRLFRLILITGIILYPQFYSLTQFRHKFARPQTCYIWLPKIISLANTSISLYIMFFWCRNCYSP